jgi:tetratricopeptide (TPR) repeat protein
MISSFQLIYPPLYLSAMNQPHQQKFGRNDPCPCGSGKKFKQCCQAIGGDGQNKSERVGWLLEQARSYAYQQRNFIAAEDCYRQVLAFQANNMEALAGVGQGLCWRHRRAEGRQFLVKAGKLMLRHAEKMEARMLMNLAEQLQLWGEIDLALLLFKAAAKLVPANPAAHYGVASCLHRLNRIDLALKAMDKALHLAPHEAGCQILMAVLELESKQAPIAQARLEAVIAREQDPHQLARACLELAKVYDKQNRYAEAFALISQASELQRQLPAVSHFDGDYIFKKIALYKTGYDQDLLSRWSLSDFDDHLPAPVFLVGFLRSGTTLTEQVLSAHPGVMTSDENHLIDETIAELERLAGIKSNPPEALRSISLDQVRALRQFYWQRVSVEYGQVALKKCFVNKVALNSIELGFISTLFPEAKIIFALRDPRDICLSCAMQSFTLSNATVNMLSWSGIAKQYAAVMDLWLNLREKINAEFLELRYEDTVAEFETRFRQVFTLLGLEWHPDVIRYHEKLAGKFISTPSFTAVSKPLYSSAVARWHGYQDYFGDINPIIQPYIKAFGYD